MPYISFPPPRSIPRHAEPPDFPDLDVGGAATEDGRAPTPKGDVGAFAIQRTLVTVFRAGVEVVAVLSRPTVRPAYPAASK